MAQSASAQGGGSSVSQRDAEGPGGKSGKDSTTWPLAGERSFSSMACRLEWDGMVRWSSRFSLFAWHVSLRVQWRAGVVSRQAFEQGLVELCLLSLGDGRSSPSGFFWVRCRRAEGAVRVGWVCWDGRGSDCECALVR